MNESLKSIIRPLLSRRIGVHRVWDGPIRGARIVTSWHDYPAGILGQTERELLRWFETNVRQGETWLDIGAHYGYTAIALSRLVGASGRVVAFEPVLTTAGYLSKTRSVNAFQQLTIIGIGLGLPERCLTSIDLPVERGMVDSTVKNQGSHEKILVTSLDWLWPRISGESQRIDGVKIDVQGMELSVLRGMTELLRRDHPRLVVELHTGVDRQEFLEVVRAAGYSSPGRAIKVEIPPACNGNGPSYFENISYAFLGE
jgi:FkbM family methyltransferase